MLENSAASGYNGGAPIREPREYPGAVFPIPGTPNKELPDRKNGVRRFFMWGMNLSLPESDYICENRFSTKTKGAAPWTNSKHC